MRRISQLGAGNYITDEGGSNGADIGRSHPTLQLRVNPRLLHYAEAWRHESRDPSSEPGRKQPSGMVRRVTRRVLSRRDVLRDWLRYKANERT